MSLSRNDGRSEAFLEVRAAAEKHLEIVDQIPAGTIGQDSWLELAARIGLASAELRNAMAQANRALGFGSGRDAILRHLKNHIGEAVPADALAGVAGISEWPRRVRELRVEFGWPIESGVHCTDMPHDHYRLTSPEPDQELAEGWRTAKTSRQLKKADGKSAAGKDRLLHYLRALSPRAADKEQLFYVAGIQEWPRRLRELEEEGWQIVSNIDDPSLPPGSYRLATSEKRPPRVRKAIKLRYQILERDQRTCQDCRRVPEQGVSLQIHHLLPVHRGGDNSEDNLVTLCSHCHGGRHSLMGESSTWDELLDPQQEPDLLSEP
ncbi:HNH endonuclease [Kitasatospora sp. P5_F3]